jgi:hypothetical protein
MNSIQNMSCDRHRGWNLPLREITQLAFGIGLALFLFGPAFAQHTGGNAGTGSTGGYGTPAKIIGIGAGSAAGVGVLYWTRHGRASVTGCVESYSIGLTLIDEKKKQAYFLLPGQIRVKPGERIRVLGRKLNYGEGAQFFQARKLVKELGSCR